MSSVECRVAGSLLAPDFSCDHDHASFGRPALPRTLASIGETLEATARTVDAWHFGDSAADANGLAALVVQCAKRATSPSLWKLEAQDLPVSQPGDLHILTD